MKKPQPEPEVPRPLKKAEYQLVFMTRQAEKGWTDCLAAARNACVDAWEMLTVDPTRQTERQYKLKGSFAIGTYHGVEFDRWQYKITDAGRLWYFVENRPKLGKFAGRVLLERCEPGHPSETDRRGR